MKIKSNRFFLKIGFLILSLSLISADSRLSKLSISNLLKIGYDSNVSRISETESFSERIEKIILGSLNLREENIIGINNDFQEDSLLLNQVY